MALEHFITECRNTNKRLIKQELILLYTNKYPVLKEMLAYCYEPFRMYHISIKNMEVPLPGNEGAVDVWEDFKFILREMEQYASPRKNKKMFCSLLSRCNKETQELFIGIAGKKLKAGFSSKVVNTVLPGLINVFNVALASLYNPQVSYVVKVWKASKKMDGMRIVIMRIGGGWEARTRNGKDITDRVQHLFPSCEQAYQKWGYTFFDGEGYKHRVDSSRIAGDILGGEKDCSYLGYHVFAMGRDVSKFLKGDPSDIIYPEEQVYCGYIIFVSHIDIPNDPKRIFAFAARMEELGYEGGMLRNPNAPYIIGRTNKMLKVKTWLLDPEKRKRDTLTVICTGINCSEQWRASKDSDKMVKVLTMESVEFESPDGTVGKVGTGFTYQEKDEIYANRVLYIHEKLDIRFQQQGSKGGKIFPVFEGWRLDI